MGSLRRRRGPAGPCDLIVHSLIPLWHCDVRILGSWWWGFRLGRLWARRDIWSLLITRLIVSLIPLSILAVMPHSGLHLSIDVACLEECGGSLRILDLVRVPLHILPYFIEGL